MTALFKNGQWYFKVSQDSWVHVGEKLKDLETILRGYGIVASP
jgi:hypothetical protein